MDKIALLEAEIAKQKQRVAEVQRLKARYDESARQEDLRLDLLEEELADEIKWRRYNPEVF